MSERGNIYSPFAARAKEYAWAACLRHAPRQITPSDIDYVVDCNGRFLLFEMKSEGAEMPTGQRILLERLLEALHGKAFLIIVEHEALSKIDMGSDVLRFHAWTYSGGAVRRIGPFDGSHFPAVYAAFFQWAEGDVNAVHRQARPVPRTGHGGVRGSAD